jgi:hypothetical protein
MAGFGIRESVRILMPLKLLFNASPNRTQKSMLIYVLFSRVNSGTDSNLLTSGCSLIGIEFIVLMVCIEVAWFCGWMALFVGHVHPLKNYSVMCNWEKFSTLIVQEILRSRKKKCQMTVAPFQLPLVVTDDHPLPGRCFASLWKMRSTKLSNVHNAVFCVDNGNGCTTLWNTLENNLPYM